ncbi:hypothetical protein [Endozoicomonas numazuensis]|uniref:Cyanovirin-N domain-containing protein n=1 Tax=Endozoicomonas numazuensis TaxID=1137799 RepID=A0A081NDN4_9GAMM|nr:hypothetical protein [Endozoicomonas numazuensis]KEQ16557.1 hypothetical protein GZ78_22225 [Endozoicomonas numazuensis]
MRHLILLLLILPSFSWAMLEVPFYQSGWPKGDYQKNCKECRLEDNRLICSCEAPDKKFYKRSLDLSLCSLNIVSVKKGILHCETDLSFIPDDPVVEDDLEEEFSDSIDPADGLPLGSYRNYCEPCSIEDGILECSCKIDGWFWDSSYKATLPLESCEESDKVLYSGGLLFCSLDSFLSFHELGSSCRNCKLLKGTKLSCRCDKTPCGWSSTDIKKGRNKVAASLSSIQNCSAEIKNCNGVLRCGECRTWDYYDQTVLSRPVEGKHPRNGYCYPNSIW